MIPEMIEIRPMTPDDFKVFKKWLYTPHVARWYQQPLDWITEIEHQDDAFSWIHHYIVECDGVPIGFCQYYACKDSEELWEGYTAPGGSYSIDYMIGECDYLGRGFGKEIICALIQKIKENGDAKRIVVQPEKENKISRKALLSCGFNYDSDKDIFVLTF